MIWNIWLSVRLHEVTKISGQGGQTVVKNVVNSYTTDLTTMIEQAQESMVMVAGKDDSARSTRSGFIFSVDPVRIVTAGDMFAKADQTDITFDNGIHVQGNLIGFDEDTKIAVYECKPDFNVEALQPGDSSLVSAGENVAALGARRESGSAMVSEGVVSEIGQYRSSSSSAWYEEVLETDASVTSQNSGGALLNRSGEVLGVLIPSPSGAQNEEGYALAVNEVRNIYNAFVNDGTLTRGSLQACTRPVRFMPAYEKSALGLPLDLTNGVRVISLLEESEDGLRAGDVITKIDDKKLTDNEDLRNRLYMHKPGDTIKVDVLRDGEEVSLSVVLK